MSIPLCFEVVLFSSLLTLQNQIEEQSHRLEHVRLINDALNRVTRDFIWLARLASKYSKEGLHASKIAQLFKDIHEEMAELSKLYAHDTQSLRIIEETDRRIWRVESDLQKGRRAIASVPFSEMEPVIRAWGRAIDKDTLAVYDCGLLELADESSRAIKDDTSLEIRKRILVILKCALAASVLLATGGAIWYSRQMVGRLALLGANAKRLAGGMPLLAKMNGHDEIARLDETFHIAANLIDQAMRKERTILKNTREVICSFDESYKLQSLNDACQSLLGKDPDSLLGLQFFALFPASQRAKIEQSLNQARESKQSAKLELQAERLEQAPIDVSLSASFSPEDKMFYCSLYDLSSQKELERVRREVTAMITHDLKSPLQTVRNYLEMLELGRLGDLNERGMRLLSLAEQETVRMADLIQSVLQLEQLRSGRLSLQSAKVDLKEVVEQSRQSVQLSADKKNITIVEELRPSSVAGEAKWIKQICVNIIGNAINYSPEGSTITLSMSATDNFCEVRITDEGPGLTAEEKALIFERFNRLERKADQAQGSGLGLTICKELMDLHKGYIRVESELEKGSTFILGFPANNETS